MHVIRLRSDAHRVFIGQRRKDPITHELLRAGDDIVICSREKIAFSVESWNGACPLCGNKRTLSSVPQQEKIKVIKRHHWFWYVTPIIIFIFLMILSIS